jgi:hypothetical protein
VFRVGSKKWSVHVNTDVARLQSSCCTLVLAPTSISNNFIMTTVHSSIPVVIETCLQLAMLFLAWNLAMLLPTILDKVIFWGVVVSTLLSLRLATGTDTGIVL